MIQVSITNRQSTVAVDEERLRAAVRTVLEDAGRASAEISVAVVDDRMIHTLNRKYLDHEDATDVLSFPLQDEQQHLEGEVVASAETAAEVAESFDWSAADELLLYVVHGTLHLVGYDDKTPQASAEMRVQEAHVLARFGLQPCYEPTLERRGHSDAPRRHTARTKREANDISVGELST